MLLFSHGLGGTATAMNCALDQSGTTTVLHWLHMKKSLSLLYLVQALFIVPSILYWLDGIGWDVSRLSYLTVFPVLGLVAFTLMWGHIMVAYFRHKYPDMFDYAAYYRQSSHAVLILIILHPLLLVLHQASNDLTVFDYAAPAMRVFIVFGSLAFLGFMIYEVVNRLKEKPAIKRNWQYVVAMNRVAFILVYIHGLMLGQHLASGPMRLLWLFFGLTTAAYYIWAYRREIRRDSRALNELSKNPKDDKTP